VIPEYGPLPWRISGGIECHSLSVVLAAENLDLVESLSDTLARRSLKPRPDRRAWPGYCFFKFCEDN